MYECEDVSGGEGVCGCKGVLGEHGGATTVGGGATTAAEKPTTTTTTTTSITTTITVAVAQKPCADGLLARLGSRHASQLHVGSMHELRAPEEVQLRGAARV